MAKKNIEFKEGLTIDELRNEYSSARALIFPQMEDFGITPLEANASGTPVIAYGKGGALETMIPYPENRATGLFFKEQTTESINDAILQFEKIENRFKKQDLTANAQRFSLKEFSEKIKKIVLGD